MITIKNYKPEDQPLWDNFISRSKNGVFIFYRDYMDYHSDRFSDSSLLFFKGKKLIALLPANIRKNVLFSHEGLTFGGFLTNSKMTVPLMIEIFSEFKDYLKANGITKVFYKAIPHIYHSLPAEEDLYALIRNKAQLIRRDVSSTIFMEEKIPFNKNRRRNIKKSKKYGLKIKKSHDFEQLMSIKVKELIKNYGVKPTHSAAEMNLLASRFPDNIKLFTTETYDKIYGGVIIFDSNNVAHAQYQING